jgi:hypothetical protein
MVLVFMAFLLLIALGLVRDRLREEIRRSFPRIPGLSGPAGNRIATVW